MSRALLLLLGLALAGCTVGPDFQTPKPDLPAAWKDPAAVSSADPDPRWWQGFNDPELDSLIARAVAGNLTLQQSVGRIAEARGQVQVQRAQGLPTLSANGSYTREKLGEAGLLSAIGGGGSGSSASGGITSVSGFNGIGGLSSATDLYQVGFDASWELDLFGKVRRSVEEAQAQAEEQEESRKDSLVSLEAEVARDYLQLRSQQALQAITRDEAARQQQSLDLTRLRAKEGLAGQLDVDQAASRLTQTQAQLPQFEQQSAQSINALSVLIGSPPGTLDAELGTVTSLPEAPATPSVGLPATLARRRPDIRNAEAALHAATAGIGVAVAQLYPDISLSASSGQRALTAQGLTDWSNNFYQLGPSISLPIFEGGRLSANVRIAEAQQQEAALNYRQTILNALQDVENGLVALRTDAATRDSRTATVTIAAHQLSLAQLNYRNGLGDFLNVLDAENTLLSARQDEVRGQLQVALDAASLYKAIGGGWEIDEKPADRS